MGQPQLQQQHLQIQLLLRLVQPRKPLQQKLRKVQKRQLLQNQLQLQKSLQPHSHQLLKTLQLQRQQQQQQQQQQKGAQFTQCPAALAKLAPPTVFSRDRNLAAPTSAIARGEFLTQRFARRGLCSTLVLESVTGLGTTRIVKAVVSYVGPCLIETVLYVFQK